MRAWIKSEMKNYQFLINLGDIIEFCQGVSFPGRYGHGKPAKPVNGTFGTT
ncbi:hypothetical protein AALB52_25525 [Lachnospiraceae bacterium 38-14]